MSIYYLSLYSSTTERSIFAKYYEKTRLRRPMNTRIVRAARSQRYIQWVYALT